MPEIALLSEKMETLKKVKTCAICGKNGGVSLALGVCRPCILDNYQSAERYILEAHSRVRAEFGLPATPPKRGISCTQCVNMCLISEGEIGYCGVRKGKRGHVVHLSSKGAIVEWYHDPLPTNCVADFVCPAGTGCGYPKYSKRKGAEHGYRNLAVFYGACNFSCLFCQNWQFRNLTKSKTPLLSAEELASKADDKTTCICFFGGDPTPQIEHALKTSQIIIEGKDVMRICFETNGSMNRKFLKKMAEASYSSGGCIKFDLKTWHSNLNKALCGVDNRWTLSNFRWLADFEKRKEDRGVPFLVASTLLVPGYIEKEEVAEIAKFIASLNPEIPYSLLAFSPRFHMTDLPPISGKTAKDCLKEARSAGLKKVRLGNIHLVV